MILSLILILCGLALLLAGAELLVRGASSLAARFGLSPLLIGLTVVAFATSAPEAVVSAGAALGGHGDIAVGNVVGSNIFNILFILGLASLIRPISIQLSILKSDAPIMVAASSVVFLIFAFSPILTRSFGLLFLFLLTAYIVLSFRLAKREDKKEVITEFEEGIPRPLKNTWVCAALIITGLGLLSGGAHVVVTNAVTIARLLNLSEAIIALTIIAAGTSLPELATSVVAAVRGHSDISVGNVIGSNIFNLLGILGFSSVITPLRAPDVTLLDFSMMLISACLLLPMLWTSRKLQRVEGALLLAGYLFYLYLRWPR